MSVVVTPFAPVSARRRARRYGILSSYPPTPCGLATFSAALARGLKMDGDEVGIVRVSDATTPPGANVLAELHNGSPGSAVRASLVLNTCDIAIIQHDYGLYGGTDGEEVLEVIRGLTVPSIFVAHTVLAMPTTHQRQILEQAVRMSSATVVMAQTARHRLCAQFNVDPSKVKTINHGAACAIPRSRSTRSGRPTLLTWGLLGPGKGIEWAIDALAELRDLSTPPLYVIAGRTHPKVASLAGEGYRDMLVTRAIHRGVSSSVIFDSTYRDLESLAQLIQGSSLVVLPYESRDQVTSGVLVDAIAAGRPVVATAFPHAVEMLASGAGKVVPHGDVAALSAAIRLVLSQPDVATSMEREAVRLAPALSWGAVSARYTSLADTLLSGVQAVPA